MGPKKTALSKRSLRSGDSGHEKRPKRVVQNKTVDDAVGLSRQEEQELNKALYASLNETRRSKSMSSLTGLDVVDQDFTSRPRSSGLLGKSSLPSKGNKITLGKKRSLRRGGEPLAKRLFRSDSTGSSEDNLNIDESSKDSVKSSSSSGNGSKKKIHAQRKFAQGCSLPGTPMCSPTKASTTPVKLLSRTPKTEDFLTFLCLRGSPALPPHLDFFNFSKEELPLRDDSPKASWSGRRKQIHQSCLDEHWSSSSGASDEVVNPVGDKPPSAEKCKVSQAKGSAARASAGTLETARGIASLRQGLQPKESNLVHEQVSSCVSPNDPNISDKFDSSFPSTNDPFMHDHSTPAFSCSYPNPTSAINNHNNPPLTSYFDNCFVLHDSNNCNLCSLHVKKMCCDFDSDIDRLIELNNCVNSCELDGAEYDGSYHVYSKVHRKSYHDIQSKNVHYDGRSGCTCTCGINNSDKVIKANGYGSSSCRCNRCVDGSLSNPLSVKCDNSALTTRAAYHEECYCTRVRIKKCKSKKRGYKIKRYNNCYCHFGKIPKLRIKITQGNASIVSSFEDKKVIPNNLHRPCECEDKYLRLFQSYLGNPQYSCNNKIQYLNNHKVRGDCSRQSVDLKCFKSKLDCFRKQNVTGLERDITKWDWLSHEAESKSGQIDGDKKTGEFCCKLQANLKSNYDGLCFNSSVLDIPHSSYEPVHQRESLVSNTSHASNEIVRQLEGDLSNIYKSSQEIVHQHGSAVSNSPQTNDEIVNQNEGIVSNTPFCSHGVIQQLESASNTSCTSDEIVQPCEDIVVNMPLMNDLIVHHRESVVSNIPLSGQVKIQPLDGFVPNIPQSRPETLQKLEAVVSNSGNSCQEKVHKADIVVSNTLHNNGEVVQLLKDVSDTPPSNHQILHPFEGVDTYTPHSNHEIITQCSSLLSNTKLSNETIQDCDGIDSNAPHTNRETIQYCDDIVSNTSHTNHETIQYCDGIVSNTPNLTYETIQHLDDSTSHTPRTNHENYKHCDHIVSDTSLDPNSAHSNHETLQQYNDLVSNTLLSNCETLQQCDNLVSNTPLSNHESLQQCHNLVSNTPHSNRESLQQCHNLVSNTPHSNRESLQQCDNLVSNTPLSNRESLQQCHNLVSNTPLSNRESLQQCDNLVSNTPHSNRESLQQCHNLVSNTPLSNRESLQQCDNLVSNTPLSNCETLQQYNGLVSNTPHSNHEILQQCDNLVSSNPYTTNKTIQEYLSKDMSNQSVREVIKTLQASFQVDSYKVEQKLLATNHPDHRSEPKCHSSVHSSVNDLLDDIIEIINKQEDSVSNQRDCDNDDLITVSTDNGHRDRRKEISTDSFNSVCKPFQLGSYDDEEKDRDGRFRYNCSSLGMNTDYKFRYCEAMKTRLTHSQIEMDISNVLDLSPLKNEPWAIDDVSGNCLYTSDSLRFKDLNGILEPEDQTPSGAMTKHDVLQTLATVLSNDIKMIVESNTNNRSPIFEDRTVVPGDLQAYVMPEPPCDLDGSSVGASTPISSPASNNQSRSSQKRSGGDRSRRHHAPSTIEVLKSARKNLLGKLTSVARQSEKMSPNPRKKSPNSKKGQLLSRGGKSLSEGVKVHRRGLRERRSKITKEYSDDDDDDDDDVIEKEDYGNYKGRRKSSKINEKYKGRRVGSKKVKPLKRRVSERLKMLLQSPHSRRRRLISEDEDEDFPQEQKIRVKKDSEKGSGTTPTPSPKSKSVDSNSSPNTSQSPARSRRDKNESSHRKDPQRKSFKIRPLERVRTRGYSSMLASKLALKKAKTRDDKRGLNVSDGRSSNSGGNRMDGGSDASDNLSNSGGKTGSGSGNISSSSSSSNSGGKSSSGNVDDIAMPNKDGDKVTEKDVKQSPTLGRLTAGAKRESTDKQQRESASVKEVKSSGVLTPGTKDLKVKVTGSGRKSDSPSLKLTHLKKVKSSTSTSRPSSAASSTSSTSTCKTPWLSSSQSIPTFHPSESDFADPMAYIARIQPEAEPYGMCKIIPPASWKLDSSKVNEDIRFTPQVQYIHRLYNRWGPNVQRTAAINYHLLSELSGNTVTPQIGGVEIDLPQLYGLVDEAGGLSKMADKKHWANVADAMNIPKQAMDRTMRLYDIYCRHVLPYATLSRPERYDLEEEVKAIHELQTLEDEAIIRGKSMSLSYFSKVARNVQSMWFKDDPSPDQVEREYWGLVEEGEKHVAVQCGHINTLTQASAFPTKKDSPYSKHPWNLNQIPNHDACVLKYLGPVAGTTIPTMHLGMLFSTSCWSSDPHGLPYIQYHHSGGDIIWYCISKSQRCKFRSSMMELASSLISNKPRWLKEDCVMVNPGLLREKGVKVGRCVHKAREFVVIFPGAHTATITCGFSVSESVHFATTKWLPFGIDSAVALTKSGEKELFAMSSLLCRLAQDKHIDLDTLTEALPLLSSIIYKELDLRTQLHAVGLRSDKKMLNLDTSLGQIGVGANKKRLSMSEEEKTCEICSRICHLSMVYVEQEEQILCLEHGLRNIQKRKNAKSMRLFVLYNQLELETILKGAKDRLVVLSSPKAFNESGDGVGSSKTRGGTSKQ